LSAILLNQTMLDQVAFLEAKHFYADANRRIYQAMQELRDEGRPIDVLTVSGYLRDRECLQKIGGSPYLAQLADATPSAAHIGDYGKSVIGKWEVRQVIATTATILAEAYGDYGNLEDWKQSVDERMFASTRSSDREDKLVILSDATRATIEVIHERSRRTGIVIAGTSTGLPTLDARIGGLETAKHYVLAARPGQGKAQPLSAKVHTPFGWTTMGAIREGDLVTGASGKPVRVKRVFERGELPVFRVTMADGGSTLCCDEHLWFTRTRVDRRYGGSGSVKPLSEIRATLTRCESGGLNHSVAYVKPIEYEPSALPLPIHPYLMGAYIGDGCNDWVICNPEPDVQQKFISLLPESDEGWVAEDGITLHVRRRQRSKQPTQFAAAIREVGLSGTVAETKFIPPQYLAASVEDRLELLRGLCDTDGYVPHTSKNIEYSTASERLAQQIQLLVRGLGGRISCNVKQTTYSYLGKKLAGQPSYRMVFGFSAGGIVPVSSKKHLAKWDSSPVRISDRFIKTVTPEGVQECRCIELESSDHLYVTDDYIVTHNTAACTGFGIATAATGITLTADPNRETEPPTHGVVFISVEMPRQQIGFRVLSQVSRVDSVKLQRGRLSAEEHKKLVEAQHKISKLPLVIEDSSNHTVSSIRAAYRQGERKLQERFGKQVKVKLCMIDYLQLLESHAANNNREQEIAAISRGCKALAKDEGIAVLSLAQVNRDCEKRAGNDKRPMLGDLRESGTIEQDADAVIFIYRQDYYRPKTDPKDDKAEFIVAKLRDNGGTGVVHANFDPKTTSFYETSRDPDLEQLGDMFDSYLPGTHGESTLPEAPEEDEEDWRDKY
jgi:replicative DNA helicase